MKRKISVITLLIAVLFITSCTPSDSPQYVEATDFRLDTVINIRLYDGTKDQLDHCMDMIKKYDELFSNKNPNSDITKINEASPKPVAVYEDTAEILKKSLEYGRLSEGAFDVTIGAASNLWDFHSEDPEVPTESEIKDAIKTVDYNQLTVEDNTVTLKQNATDSSFTTRLDVGGIAKGFITDKIRDYLISEGVSSASISLGGNVYILGKKPAKNDDPDQYQLFIVGIQKPFSEDGTAACTLRLHDKSVVTSGIYQRYFKKDGKLYHHILDPEDGAAGKEAGITLFLEAEHQLHLVLAGIPSEVGEHIHHVGRAVEDVRHHVGGAVALDLLPGTDCGE